MGKRLFDLIISVFVLTSVSGAQTALLSESFETNGNGTRYAIFGGFSDNVGDYFIRTDGTSTIDGNKKPSNMPIYTGQDSTCFFAGEDTENGDNPNGTTAGIIFDDVNISGYDSLYIQGLFACGGKPKFDPSDYMHILVDLNNSGTWSLVGSFEADISTGTNSENFRLDSNFDGLGEGTVLDTAFKEFTFAVQGTGSLIDLKIELYLTAGDEEAAFDYIRLYGNQTGSILNPGAFSAITIGAQQIDLSWTKNSDSDSVVIVYDTVSNIGSPENGVIYNINDTIPGGGKVIYNGLGNSFEHTSLIPGTIYYYKAWSIHNGSYSTGIIGTATTARLEPTSYPDSFSVQLLGLNAILKWSNPVILPGEQVSEGFVIVVSSDSNLSIPTDGTVIEEDTVINDGGGAKLIEATVNNYVFTRLAFNTTYYFKIFPYTNTGTLIDYKTDGLPPNYQITTENRNVELFFSEYIEGSSYNKALELYNPTLDSLNLSNYRIRSASGGGGWSGQFRLNDKIPSKGVYVIAHSSADDSIKIRADTTLGSGVMSFNGDDARQLEKTPDGAIWVPIDVIGDPYADPGVGWSVAGTSSATQNHTLVRGSWISTGNIDWNGSAGTDTSNTEWEILSQDSFSNLGQHQWEMVKIVETSGNTHVLEGSDSDTYFVSLAQQPTADVVITLTSDNQLSLNPETITFSSTDWNVPKTVTITATDNTEAEGDHYSEISHGISSDDGFFNSYQIPDLEVTISDNDVAGFSISIITGLPEIREGGNGYTYSIVLNTQPSNNVNVNIAVAPSNEAIITPSIITFNNQNWNIAQTIEVSAIDDSVVEKQDTLVLTHSISSDDFNYSSLAINDIQVLLNDNDIYTVIINEIMYNSPGNDEEWIELYCAETNGIDFDQDWVLSNLSPSWRDTFKVGQSMARGGYFTIQLGSSGNFSFTPNLVFSSDPNRLNNTGSTLILTWDNRTVDSVTYMDSNPWPVEADGQGSSLELKSLPLDNSLGSNWQASYTYGGTPGAINSRDTIGPQISSILIADNNAYVDVIFDEGVFSSDSGSGGLNKDCFSISLSSGNASSPNISNITNVDTALLVGGEKTVRIFFSFSGTADGNETLQINPGDSTVFDIAGNSATVNQTKNTAKLHDQLPPTLLSTSPMDDSIGVGVFSDIIMQFSESIRAGPGYIVLSNYSDQSVVETFKTGTDIKISGNIARINPSDSMKYNTAFYLTVDDTAIMDNGGNYYIGISSPDSLNFTTSPPANTAPEITSGNKQDSILVYVQENQRLILTVTAVDAEGDSLLYKLTGGIDIDLFDIDSISGLLTFLTAPDFERPVDNDSDNVYKAEVTVSDVGMGHLSDSQQISVSVTDLDEEPPALIGSSPADDAVNVAIDSKTTFIFSEKVFADSGNITLKRYSDDMLLETLNVDKGIEIDSVKVTVVFNKNFEYGTRYYVLIDSCAIMDSVGNHFRGIQDKDELNFTTVNKSNVAPNITSGEGQDSVVITVNENQREVLTVTATDVDNDQLSYTISGGQDQNCFEIDSLIGALSFKLIPDFEYPNDADADNIYFVKVTVSDEGNLTDSQVITVIVIDVDEISPTITLTTLGGLYKSVTNRSPIQFNVSFSEKVVSFCMDSISTVNGSIDSASFSFVSGSDSARFSIFPQSEGLVSVNLAAGSAVDEAGNKSLSARFNLRYDATAPAVILESPQSPITNTGIFHLSIHFSENILELNQADITVVPECTRSSLNKINSREYTTKLNPNQEGSYKIYLKSFTVRDSAGNLNVSSDTLLIKYDITPPEFGFGMPRIYREDSTGFGFLVQSDEEGSILYSVLIGNATLNNPEEVKNDSIDSILRGRQRIVANSIDSVFVSGLEVGGKYNICIALEDQATNLSKNIAVLSIRKLGVIQDLFFSEYLEGSDKNKALEIYNPTNLDIWLEDYRIAQSTDGSGWQGYYRFPESAIIKSKHVWVLINSGADTSLFSFSRSEGKADSSAVVDYNGNDARSLAVIDTRAVGTDTTRDTTVLDVIGNPNDYQVSGWAVAGVDGGTTDHTLIRKHHIHGGNPNWNAAAGDNFQNSEWVIYPQNYFDNLGYHVQSNSTMEIYLTTISSDTLIYKHRPIIVFPGMDAQGIAGDTTLSACSIVLIRYDPTEDSVFFSTQGNILVQKRVMSNDTLEYLLAGDSPCTNYIQTLKSVTYFRQSLSYAERVLEFRVTVRKDSIESYPLCRYVVLRPKPLSVVSSAPYHFRLDQNYPNPFNPITNISYEIPENCMVSLVIYNLSGEEVCRLVEGLESAGRYTIQWRGNNDQGDELSSGVYLYRLKAESANRGMAFLKTKKLVYLK
ncbi:MAG: lamin tail domain-containing protein [Fidelibacterota bacterium]